MSISNARNLSALLDSGGDVKLNNLDNITSNVDHPTVEVAVPLGALFTDTINTLALGTTSTTALAGDTAYATSTQGTTADNALPKAGGTVTGALTVSGKVNSAGDFTIGNGNSHHTKIHFDEVSAATGTFNTVNLNSDGVTALDVYTSYRITTYIKGDTSTKTGSVYVLWDSSNYVADARSWNIRTVSRAGTSSNHSQARLSTDGLSLEVFHTINDTYTIGYKVEAFDTTNNNAAHVFGADYHWTRDGDNLSYSDGNVGIGTDSPSSPLDIKSNSTSSASSGLTITQNGAGTNPIFLLGEKSTDGSRFHMYDTGVEKIAFYSDGTDNHISSGNVGIGTTIPYTKLHVNGTARFGNTMVGDASESNVPSAPLHIKSSGVNAKMRIEDSDSSNLAFDFLVNHGSGFSIIETIGGDTGDDTRLYIEETTGNVGIGTDSPSVKLDVDGDIKSNGSKVMTAANFSLSGGVLTITTT